MSLQVRLMSPAEALAVERLHLADGQERFLPERLVLVDRFQLWGLYQGEELIAFVEVVGEPPLLWIARVGVAAPYQGMGYGAYLLRQVIAQLRRRARINELRAAIHVENEPAQRLFASVGFMPLSSVEAVGEEVVYALSLR